MDQTDQKAAYMLLRVVAGMNLLMHGVSRWLVGPGAFAGKLIEQIREDTASIMERSRVWIHASRSRSFAWLAVANRTANAHRTCWRESADAGPDVWLIAGSGLECSWNSIDVCSRLFRAAVSSAL
jgi:hypothetical protein